MTDPTPDERRVMEIIIECWGKDQQELIRRLADEVSKARKMLAEALALVKEVDDK